MEQELTTVQIWQLIGLGALVVFALVAVWMGLRTPPDDTANKARGGGADSHHSG